MAKITRLTIPETCEHSNPPIASRRLLEIDAFRGIASVLVVAYHFTHGYQFGWPDDPPININIPLNLDLGNIGVSMFFVISGFVISMTLERSKSPMDFGVSRFARLFPTFWACALLTTAFILLTEYNPFDLNGVGFVGSMTMLNGMFNLPYVDPSYWSLTQELMFYILLATIYFTLGKSQVTKAILAWAVLSAFYNVFVADPKFPTCNELRGCGVIVFNTNLAYLFAAGVMSYKIYSGDKSKLVYLTLLVALISGCVCEWPREHLKLLTPLKASLYTGLIVASAMGFLPLLRASIARFFGTISYSLYLLHQVIGLYFLHVLLQHGMNKYLAISLCFALVVSLSATVCYGVERPSNEFVRKWWRARSY